MPETIGNNENININFDSINANGYLSVGEKNEIKNIIKDLDGSELVDFIKKNDENGEINNLIKKEYKKLNEASISWLDSNVVNIKSIQQEMINAGIDLGSYGADGDFGRFTFAGIIKLQKALGLKVTGVLTSKEIGFLFPNRYSHIAKDKNGKKIGNKFQVKEYLKIRLGISNKVESNKKEEKDKVNIETKEKKEEIKDEVRIKENEDTSIDKGLQNIESSVGEYKDKLLSILTGNEKIDKQSYDKMLKQLRYKGRLKIYDKSLKKMVTACGKISDDVARKNDIIPFALNAKGGAYNYLNTILSPNHKDVNLWVNTNKRESDYYKVTIPEKIFKHEDFIKKSNFEFNDGNGGKIDQEFFSNFNNIEGKLSHGNLVVIILDSASNSRAGKKYGHKVTGMMVGEELFISDPLYKTRHRSDPFKAISYKDYDWKKNIRGVVVYKKEDNLAFNITNKNKKES